MADYNLGRATGEVSIGYDGRGLRAAQADMASTSAEAAALDASMGRVNKAFDDNRRQTLSTAEAIVQARGEVDQLRRAYQRQQEEYERGQKRVADASDRARDVLRDQADDLDAVREARINLDRAENDADRLRRQAAQSYEDYHNKLVAVRQEVDAFNRAHIQAAGGIRNMRREAEQFGDALERMSSILGTVARTVGAGGLMGMFGLASGAQLATSGAAGLNGLTSLLAGALEIIKDFSGALILLPALISSAGVSLGVLATAFHGVGQAIGSIEDPKKFMESIKDMGPITQQAMLGLQSFAEAFRGARQVVQESFFAQIVQDIQPLVQTWLPLLMNAGREIAGQFGALFHEAFSVFQDPAIQSGFNAFIQNMSVGMQAVRGAIRPFIEAWTTLSVVGSAAFQRLGIALTDVVNRFNAWIQRSAESGKLTEWIDRAITAFTNMASIIGNLAIAINNIFNAARGESGGTLENLRRLSAEFRAWTESVKGQNSIVTFFQLLQSAADTTRPIMKLLGESIAIIAGTLTRLGIAIGPGITSFFTSFRDALADLRPYVLALAPSLNEFLKVLGDTLLQVVQQLGPQLPKLFQALADAMISLAPIIPAVATGIATILEHLTPGEIQGIFLAIIALQGLSTAFSGVLAVLSLNPIVLFIGALTALGLGVVYAYNHFKGFHDFINNMWPRLQSFAGWLRTGFVNAWHSVGDAVGNALNGAKNISGQISQVMSDAVTGIGNFFATVWDDAYNWGHNLVSKIVEGMTDMLGPVGRIAIQIMETIKDPIPGSRAKVGPFAQASPEELGSKLAGDFAGGIESGSTGVGAASFSLASGASGGIAGGASIGAPGGSGNRTFDQGKSGFDQAATFLTRDLSAWSSIMSNAFGLFKDVAEMFVGDKGIIKVVASLWNRGDNPLTRPGGIAGPPQAAQQQAVPGVPSVPIKGVAPIPELVPQGPAAAQQTVPGVPNKPFATTTTGTGSAHPPASVTGGAPPAGPLPPVSGAAGTGTFSIPPQPGTAGTPAAPGGVPTIPLVQNADGTWTSSDPAWAHLIQRESSGINQRQSPSTVDVNTGGNEAEGLFQITPATWRAHGGTEFAPNPLAASPQDQAKVAARIFNANPTGSDWGAGLPGREDAGALLSGITTPPVTTGPGATPGRPLRPGVLQGGPEEGLKPAATNVAGIIESLFPEVTTIGGVHADSLSYHPSGHALDIMLPGDYNSPENIALGNRINEFLKNNAEALGIGDTIFRMQYAATGQPVKPYDSSDPTDPDQRHDTHIHTTFQGPGGIGGDQEPQFQTDLSRLNLSGLTPEERGRALPATPATSVGAVQTPGLPRGPGGITRGGLRLPSDVSTYAIGGAAALAGVGGLATVSVLRRMGSAARTAYLRRNFNKYDARAKADVLRSLSPAERAAVGVDPAITFGEPGVPDVNTRGINADISGTTGRFPGVSDAHNARLAELDSLSKQRLADMVARGANPDMNPLSGLTEGEAQEAARIIQQYPAETFTGTPETGTPPARTPASSTGSAAPSVTGDVGRGGGIRGALGTAGRLLALSGPGLSPDVATVVGRDARGNPITTEDLKEPTERALGFNPASLLGAPATGQESTQTPGVIYGPNGQVISAGPRAPSVPATSTGGPAVGSAWRQRQAGETVTYNQPPPVQGPFAPGSLGGGPGAQAERRGSTPVHVTNPQQMPGGTQAPPVVSRPVQPTSTERALAAPKPGDPGFIGPVAPRPARDQGPQPGAQAERRGAAPTIGEAATQNLLPGQVGTGGTQDAGKAATKSPIDQFQDTLSSVSSIAGDAFQIFNDIIRNIGAAANMTDLLVRGFANTEDVMFYIDEMQTFITTAADIAKLVGDVGGMVGGASGGADMGAGAAIAAIAGIVSTALEVTNTAIDLGQEVYHEVTKYAGYIIGSFLGGPGTGPLGGNVRMLLNTSTNQLYTYSEDNPQNKNTFDVPLWQRSYQQTQAPTTVQQQTNIYAGPGQSPRDMMNETMWLVGTGSPAVASVSGQD